MGREGTEVRDWKTGNGKGRRGGGGGKKKKLVMTAGRRGAELKSRNWELIKYNKDTQDIVFKTFRIKYFIPGLFESCSWRSKFDLRKIIFVLF